MVPAILGDALNSYRERLEHEWPGRVKRVVLFGSWARGEADEESDVDVLVLLDAGTSRERLRAIEIGAEVGFEHRLVLEPVVLSDAQWAEMERREQGFVSEVLQDGAEVVR